MRITLSNLTSQLRRRYAVRMLVLGIFFDRLFKTNMLVFPVSPAIAWLIAGIAVLGAEIFLSTAYLWLLRAFGAERRRLSRRRSLTFHHAACRLQQCSRWRVQSLSVIAVRRRNAGKRSICQTATPDSGQWVTVDVVGDDGHCGCPIPRCTVGCPARGNEPHAWPLDYRPIDGTRLVLGRRF